MHTNLNANGKGSVLSAFRIYAIKYGRAHTRFLLTARLIILVRSFRTQDALGVGGSIAQYIITQYGVGGSTLERENKRCTRVNLISQYYCTRKQPQTLQIFVAI